MYGFIRAFCLGKCAIKECLKRFSFTIGLLMHCVSQGVSLLSDQGRLSKKEVQLNLYKIFPIFH